MLKTLLGAGTSKANQVSLSPEGVAIPAALGSLTAAGVGEDRGIPEKNLSDLL